MIICVLQLLSNGDGDDDTGSLTWEQFLLLMEDADVGV